jgi:hypothetical protein
MFVDQWNFDEILGSVAYIILWLNHSRLLLDHDLSLAFEK